MPNPIKAFFEKKKAEAKFKLAGPGQKLGDAHSAAEQTANRRAVASAATNRAGPSATGQHRPASAAQASAAQAALSRLNVSDRDDDFAKKRSQAAIRAQVQKELEAEKKVLSRIAITISVITAFSCRPARKPPG